MSYIDKWVNKTINDTLEKVSKDIHIYEMDCRFADDKDECSQCNDNVFGSIYQIIHKHKKEIE